MADRVWHRGYWVSKAKTTKGSPWFKGLLVVAVLWVWGHSHSTDDDKKHPGPRPSTSASSPAVPAGSGHAKH